MSALSSSYYRKRGRQPAGYLNYPGIAQTCYKSLVKICVCSQICSRSPNNLSVRDLVHAYILTHSTAVVTHWPTPAWCEGNSIRNLLFPSRESYPRCRIFPGAEIILAGIIVGVTKGVVDRSSLFAASPTSSLGSGEPCRQTGGIKVKTNR